MKLNIPFYPNDGDGKQCFQACMRSILNYYELPDKTLQELDATSGRHRNEWTWTPQVIYALHQLGINSTYYTQSDLRQALDVKKYIREQFGKQATKYLQLTNVDSVQTSTKWVITSKRYEERAVPKEEIIAWLDKKQPVIALLDWNVITRQEKSYQGHAVVITGYDEKHFFVHHNGPTNAQAHLPITYKNFFEAQTPPTDHDLIHVQGIKSC